MIWQRWDELSDRLAGALESPDPEGSISASGDPELVELFAGGFNQPGHKELN